MEKQKRILNFKQQIYFSSAIFGLMISASIINGFGFYYATYVIGLNALLSSMAMSLGLIILALSGPFFGYLSDKKKPGKFGKRKPALLYGAPINMFFFYFMWRFPYALINDIRASPDGFSIPAGIYYLILNVCFSLLSSYMWASYNAMLPEISEDEKNRIQISNLQAIFTLLASIIGLVLPLLFRGMMSKDELINFMALIFIPIIICIIIISIYIMIFKIREPVEDLLKDKDRAGGKTLLAVKNEHTTSLKEEFKNLFLPLKNRDFAIFQGTTFFINAGLKIPLTILLPILEYVLFISDEQLPIYILIVLPFAVLGFFVWSKFPSRYGLRKSFLISLITISLILLSTFILLANFSIAVIRLLGLLIIALFLFAMIPIFVYPSPIVSKIIDTEIEKEIERNGPFKTVEERYRFSGRFFGFYTMILNFAAGVGTLILGLILKGNEQNPVIITLLLPLTGLFTIIASIFLKKMKIR